MVSSRNWVDALIIGVGLSEYDARGLILNDDIPLGELNSVLWDIDKFNRLTAIQSLFKHAWTYNLLDYRGLDGLKNRLRVSGLSEDLVSTLVKLALDFSSGDKSIWV